jgi:DNA-binding NarL/FixJ family response regulator
LDGLDLLHLAKEEGLARRFLVVTDRRDERVIQLLIAGRHDVSFVGIEAADTEPLEIAMRNVADGRNVCDLQLRAEWARLRGDPLAYGSMLTDAEQEVLAALAVLGGDQEVASYRGTSPATVQTQRKRIMQKLNLRTQAQLVSYAACRGLVRYESGQVFRPGFQWKELLRKCDNGDGVSEAALI